MSFMIKILSYLSGYIQLTLMSPLIRKLIRLVIYVCIVLAIFNLAFQLSKHVQQNKETSTDDIENADDFIEDQQNSQVKHNVLLWTPKHCKECFPFHSFGGGNYAFRRQKCKYTNCYITDDRNALLNLTNFDAIFFNGRQIPDIQSDIELPHTRSPQQRYVYLQLESADRFPVCNKMYDNFFNWTITYKLDSSIPWPYFKIKNNDNVIVGPKINMEWIYDMEPINEDLKIILDKKTKTVAWFVSNCKTNSAREKFVKELGAELERLSGKNDLIDVYGRCGPLKCPKNESSECLRLLEENYFFYLALENSFDEDYVTEKVSTALRYHSVPIVYGEADYTRFLPPGSYLDARKLDVKALATAMLYAVRNRTHYYEYFRWHNYYTYTDSYLGFVCDLCEKLNNDKEPSTYPYFRYWWNKDYIRKCW